jgi:LysR family hydrogen peroxide-inducible transcriptional activator
MDLTAIIFTELRYVVARATSLETFRHLVAAGIGCTLLPALAVASLVSTKAVVARPFQSPAPYRRIGLVWRRSVPDEAGLRILAAFIRSRVPRAARAVKVAREAGRAAS